MTKYAHLGSSSDKYQDTALGIHVTVEFYECDSVMLNDRKRLENCFVDAARQSGATVLSSNFHGFEPQGISGVVIIAESHFTVHTWPEHEYAAIDIFSCGSSISFEKAIDVLKVGLKAENVVVSSLMNRGVVSNNGVERMVPVFKNRTQAYALSWKERFEQSNAWGLLTSLDIYDCNPDIIRDEAKIKQFVFQLCDHIQMQRYGECVVVDFGEDERVSGFSMTQLIETSLISGHFANQSNTAYLDVFSCKFYEPREMALFANQFFEGEHYKMQVALRY